MKQTGIVREYKGQGWASSELIAEHFEKRHDIVIRAIKSLKCSEEFRKRNYAERLITKQLQVGNTQKKFYMLTENGFTFLVMGFTGEKSAVFKEKYIEAFNQMRDYLNKPQLPKDFPTALRAYATEMEKHQETQKKLIQAEPHILFSKTVQATDKTIDMKKVAGIIGIKNFGRNKLFSFLRIEKILMRDNIPYRTYINRNYFEIREILMKTKNGDQLFTQTLVTQEGLAYIIKKLKQFNIIKTSD